MENTELDRLRYPIGRFSEPSTYPENYVMENLGAIATFPERLKNAVSRLTTEQLDTAYRPGGWTIRQVIHHCADSHMNCFIRIKWTLTEDNPTIKYYFEDRWSDLPDNLTMEIEPTLALLEGLHYRIVFLLKNISQEALQRTFIHPEHQKELSLKQITGLYAWHGNHHLAHITGVLQRNGW